MAVPLASFACALLVGALVLLATGQDPIDTYRRILERAVTADGALSGSLVAATPLLFTGLAAAISFRAGLFNIGGEGQLVVGAIAASGVGLAMEGSPGWLLVTAMVVAGAAGGAAWGAIPGALRAFASTNEIITSLMLNYVAANLATYLIFGSESHWRSLEGSGAMFPTGRRLSPEASWPALDLGELVVPFGFLVGAVVAVQLFVLLRRTRFGFEVAVIADSPPAARYAGMRNRRTVLAVLALSGAVAGIGGASNIGDTRHVLDPRGLNQAGYGYAGIVVAALARLNPLAVVFTSIVMGGLANAGRALQGPDFPAGLVGTLQG
ncbi:MAG: ABC transporter permease, partial [Actinomycetota bacterium]|nr:ABC transporter permease [Actinomycetota bacterium]